MFATVKPEQFNVNSFTSANALWQQVPFQIDDSGDGNQFIIFDSPVFVSDDNQPLLSTVNGFAVFNANGKFAEPPAQPTFALEAERFAYTLGSGGYDGVQNVASLNGEYVEMPDTSFAEMVFEDGTTATQRAYNFAQFFLLQQIAYADGGIKIPWNPQLTAASEFGLILISGDGGVSSVIDRVEINSSPTGGFFLAVDLTTERQRTLLSRNGTSPCYSTSPAISRPGAVVAGCRNLSKVVGRIASNSRFPGAFLMDFINGGLMVDNNLTAVRFDTSTANNPNPIPSGATLAVGSPIVKLPTKEYHEHTQYRYAGNLSGQRQCQHGYGFCWGYRSPKRGRDQTILCPERGRNTGASPALSGGE